MTDDPETFDELVNRRQYFRVIDKVSIEIAKVDDSKLAAEEFELSPEFGLISEFQLLDVESKHLLRTLTDKDKNLGQFLKILNKKLDSLARVISLNKQIIPAQSIKEVNLSEGGLSIACEGAFKKGEKLAIKLILFPSYSGLLLEGRVLSCTLEQTEIPETPTQILHVEFMDISEAHQQLIARHIIRLQSKQKHHST